MLAARGCWPAQGTATTFQKRRHLTQRPRGINAKEEHPNGYSSYFSVGIRAAFGSETEGYKQQKRNTFLAFLFQILSGLGRHLAQRPRGIKSKRGTPKRIFLLFHMTICNHHLSGLGDSNARPLRPERSALPTALNPEAFNSDCKGTLIF